MPGPEMFSLRVFAGRVAGLCELGMLDRGFQKNSLIQSMTNGMDSLADVDHFVAGLRDLDGLQRLSKSDVCEIADEVIVYTGACGVAEHVERAFARGCGLHQDKARSLEHTVTRADIDGAAGQLTFYQGTDRLCEDTGFAIIAAGIIGSLACAFGLSISLRILIK